MDSQTGLIIIFALVLVGSLIILYLGSHISVDQKVKPPTSWP